MTPEELQIEITKLETKAIELVENLDLEAFLQQMAWKLEIPYAVHKYHQDQQEAIAKKSLPLESERRTRYFHHINGHLIEVLKTKLHQKRDNQQPVLVAKREKAWEEFINTCDNIDQLQDLYSLVTNLGYQLETDGEGYKAIPGPKSRNQYLKLAEDTQRFRWFSSIGLNAINGRRQASKKLYPEHLVPPPGKSIDQTTICHLAQSFTFKRHLLLNLTELRIQLVHDLGEGKRREVPPISINDKKVSLSHTISVVTLLSFISRLQVAQIDAFASRTVKEVDEEVYKRFPAASSFAQVKAQSMAKPTSKLFEIAAEARENEKEVDEAQKWRRQQVDQQLKKTSWLCRFNKKELIAWIGKALNIDNKEVNTALSLIDFKRTSSQDTEKANYLWQPLVIEKRHISWLPNTMAYIVPSEIVSNTLFSMKAYGDSSITEVSERIISQWFENNGFTVLPEDDKVYPSEGPPQGDFDALAYKNGHYYHFELKQTAIRNDLKKKLKYKRELFKKAKSQLKRGREYILNHEEEIRIKMALNDEQPICHENLHSYLLTNSTDFDKEYFDGMLKISLQELYLVLFQCELYVGMELIDFYEYQLLRIEQLLKTKVPETIKKVILGDTPKTQEDLEMARRFFAYHGRKLREKLPFYTKHPLWAIESNWYTPRPDIGGIRYQQVLINGVNYSIPS